MQSPAIESARSAVERYRPALLLAAIYDGVLGLAFLFFLGPIFRALGVAVPADPVYAQLAAGLIAVMGFGLALAWRDPLINADLVMVGAVFKAFYVVLAIYAQLRGELPHGLFLIFAVIDAIFLLVFLACLRETTAARQALGRVAAGRASS